MKEPGYYPIGIIVAEYYECVVIET